MNNKPSQSHQSFISLVESLSGKSPPELYKSLSWSRERYYQQRARGGLSCEHLEPLRVAAHLSKAIYYDAVANFQFPKGNRGRPPLTRKHRTKSGK